MARKRNNLPARVEDNKQNNSDKIDVSGLSHNQLRFLSLRPYYLSDAQTAHALHITPTCVYLWKRQPAYNNAHNNLVNYISDVNRHLADSEFMHFEPMAAKQIAKIGCMDTEIASDKDRGNILRACERGLEYRGRGRISEKGVTVGIQLIFPPGMHIGKHHKPIEGDYEVIEED